MALPYGGIGTKVYIAPAVVAVPADAAAYAALSWTEVGGVQGFPAHGDQSAELTASELGSERVKKAKGPRNAGTVSMTCTDYADDTGQAAMAAAEATEFNYPFKVTTPNRATTGGTDRIRYFTALVLSDRLGDLTPDGIATRVFDISINSPIVQVAPT
jgi:hypothetical protein